jgi:replication initiation and membrane attachment protein DnaB
VGGTTLVKVIFDLVHLLSLLTLMTYNHNQTHSQPIRCLTNASRSYQLSWREIRD